MPTELKKIISYDGHFYKNPILVDKDGIVYVENRDGKPYYTLVTVSSTSRTYKVANPELLDWDVKTYESLDRRLLNKAEKLIRVMENNPSFRNNQDIEDYIDRSIDYLPTIVNRIGDEEYHWQNDSRSISLLIGLSCSVFYIGYQWFAFLLMLCIQLMSALYCAKKKFSIFEFNTILLSMVMIVLGYKWNNIQNFFFPIMFLTHWKITQPVKREMI